MISYVRFLYIKRNREMFRDEVLAELLPPLESDGTSHLWDALGRQFTGLTYAEADRLSKKNKEFIRGLFPEGTIYTSLLPKQAQDVVGKVGAQTRGVERMLRRIGFRYAERVDPFDGGPHFSAPTDEVTLVQRTRKSTVCALLPSHEHARSRSLVAIALAEAPYFRCVLAHWFEHGEGGAGALGEDAAAHLGVKVGDEVWVLGLD